MKKCIGCGVELQMEDIKKPGYIKDINQDYCQRCFRMTHYNDLTIDILVANKKSASISFLVPVYNP